MMDPIRRLTTVIVIILRSNQIDTIFKNLTDCKTYVFFNENFNETYQDLVAVSFLRSTKSVNIINYRSDPYPLKDLNLNYVAYYYPRYQCQVNSIHLFLDVLLNETLFEGRHFKVIAIFTDANDAELTSLANLMSPYVVPIILIQPSKDFHVNYIKQFYRFYDNILFIFPSVNFERPSFLIQLIEKLKARLITVLYDSDEADNLKEISVISEYLTSYSNVCLNIYHITFKTYQHNFDILQEMEKSNIYVFLFKDYTLSVKLIDHFNKLVKKDTAILIYNHNSSNTEKVSHVSLSIQNNKLQIFLIKDLYITHPSQIFNWPLRVSINQIRPLLIKQYQTERTFSLQYRNHFNDFLSTFEFHYYFSYGDSLPKNDIEVYNLRKNNGLQNYSLVYSSYTTYFQETNGWTCWECETLPKLHPVCRKRNCSAGYYPVYLSSGCCWNCLPCYPGYIKPTDNQAPCFKCQHDTVANTNKTKCLPFTYKHFQITYFQRIVAAALSILGCICHTFIFAVFLYYKNTPIVKSSNFTLSMLQISLHAIFNVHSAIVILEQQQHICYIHGILGGYFLKIIMSIYIIKTNQLLAIFQSSTKIKKNVCLTFKQAAFPATYITANIFVTVVFLTTYKKFEYGIFEQTDFLIKYKYCDTGTYFYLDLTSVIILSIVCSVQAFLARTLPANYNETYYIFLGMFTTTNLLLLSIPLDAGFDTDGQKSFVNSLVMYSANMALISIAYGYKIHIMLFQKHRNTKEAFQKIMHKAMQDNLRKLKR